MTFVQPGCEHCRQLLHNLDAVADRYLGAVQVVAIALGTRDTVNAFAKELSLRFPVAVDDQQAFSRHFGGTVVPLTLATSAEGRIVQVLIGEQSATTLEVLIDSDLSF
ncbi:MAG: TlpA disulfide reductase family protein [Acidobacteria bacterium]|nr:TlpA disulfide reductase family protein [Acidobacteriota bacterium]